MAYLTDELEGYSVLAWQESSHGVDFLVQTTYRGKEIVKVKRDESSHLDSFLVALKRGETPTLDLILVKHEVRGIDED